MSLKVRLGLEGRIIQFEKYIIYIHGYIIMNALFRGLQIFFLRVKKNIHMRLVFLSFYKLQKIFNLKTVQMRIFLVLIGKKWEKIN